MASGNGAVALPEPSLEGEVPVERALALRRTGHAKPLGLLPVGKPR